MKKTVSIATLLLAACSSSTTGTESRDQEVPTVAIETFAFKPRTITLDRGDELVWRNDDDILHTVTSGTPKKQGVPGASTDRRARPDGMFDEDLELDDEFMFRFEEPGRYTYYCDIHAGMVGRVVVTE